MKRQKVDFLIRYEHKVRELESIMLIRTELERRGYTVAFVCNYEIFDAEQTHYDPTVVVSPAIYGDDNIIGEIVKYRFNRKFANLLWEQLIGVVDEEDPHCTHNVTGTGQKAITFCWGKQTHDRIVRGGVPAEKAKIVGQLNLDLLRPAFRNTLLSKAELARRFNLDIDKRWMLFISSFAYCELDSIQQRLVIEALGEDYVKQFTQLSHNSRDEILRWFEAALTNHPNDIIIYRPHPDEARKSQVLKDMEAKYPNFRVISDLALKHWMNASDKVYNWYSTGLVDVTVLGKPFRLLRPCHIDRRFDYRIYLDAEKITTQEDFLNDYDDMTCRKVLNDEVFNSYYYIPKTFTYMEVCDILENMYKTDKYDMHFSFADYLKFAKVIIGELKGKIAKPMIPILIHIPGFDGKLRARMEGRKTYAETIRSGRDKNVATEQDIREVYDRIKPVIYGQQVQETC